MLKHCQTCFWTEGIGIFFEIFYMVGLRFHVGFRGCTGCVKTSNLITSAMSLRGKVSSQRNPPLPGWGGRGRRQTFHVVTVYGVQIVFKPFSIDYSKKTDTQSCDQVGLWRLLPVKNGWRRFTKRMATSIWNKVVSHHCNSSRMVPKHVWLLGSLAQFFEVKKHAFAYHQHKEPECWNCISASYNHSTTWIEPGSIS